MPNNNVQTIKIGGVTFNKADVKSSEVIVKDGKKINSVFLQDGTHVEFPTQSADNQSSVYQKNHVQREVGVSYGPHLDYGPFSGNTGEFKMGPHITTKSKVTQDKVTDFNRITDATITGTENADRYNLYGCTNTTVDVSQNDGKHDTVSDSASHTGGSIFGGGTDWTHNNNTFKLGEKDDATVVQDTFLPKNKKYKGEGTYNSGNDNK
ncbi:hypothetical protein IJ707_01435 [bacterium]|nr:hypothetical protein [bacterium]